MQLGDRIKLELEFELTEIDESDDELPYKLTSKSDSIKHLNGINVWFTKKELKKIQNK